MTVAFTLNITSAAVNDRLVNGMTIAVSDVVSPGSSPGGPHPNGTATQSSPGLQRVNVDWLSKGDHFDVSISIPNALSIVQRLVLNNDPDAPSNQLSMSFVGAPARRLSIPAAVSRGAGQLMLAVDVNFLNLTPKYQPPPQAEYPGYDVWIMESLLQRPRTWFVLVPKTQPATDSNVNIFLFFRPESNNAYTNTDDCKFGDAEAYLSSPHRDAAQANDPLPIPSFLQPTGNTRSPFRYERFPVQLEFAEQVRRSGKSVVIIFPLPHGSPHGNIADFGVLMNGQQTNIIAKLLLGLWQEGAIGRSTVDLPHVMRFAVGGYSLGGEIAQVFWQPHMDSIDELYLFDPGKGLRLGLLPGWFCSNRRLRMICPAISLNHSLDLAARFNSPAATASPPTKDYFADATGALAEPYRRAHAAATLQQSGSAAADSTSERSGIVVVSSTRARLDLHGEGLLDHAVRNATINETPFMPAIAAQEAGVFIERALAAGLSANTGTDIDVLFGLLTRDTDVEQPPIWRHRHAWPVVGGAFDGGVFRRYLELCFLSSGFQ